MLGLPCIDYKFFGYLDMNRLKHAFIVLVAFLLAAGVAGGGLVGCGKKGPLYIPNKQTTMPSTPPKSVKKAVPVAPPVVTPDTDGVPAPEHLQTQSQ